MLRLSLLATLACRLLSADGFSAELPVATPADVGLSKEQLDEFASLVQQVVRERRLAGGVVLVARHGKIAYFEAIGQQDAEQDVPMRKDTIFRIASMTKPVTSVAVMQLVEREKISLADPVSKYIAEFEHPRVLKAPIPVGGGVETIPASREVTIGDLLAHTSGLVYRFTGGEPLRTLYDEAGVLEGLSLTSDTVADNMPRLGPRPLLHQPGERWTYGLSIDVLGRLVEIVADQPLDVYFHEHILEPLAMVDTGFEVPDEDVPRLAALYHLAEDMTIVRTREEREEGLLSYSPDYPLQRPQTYFSGGAGLVSTARDYARFCQMLLNRGTLEGRRVLSPESVDLMTRNQIGDLEILFRIHGDKFGYGFGIASERFARADPFSAGSISWGGIFYTFFWVDPREELIGIFMSQVYPHGSVTAHEEFKRITYEAIDEWHAVAASATRPPQPGAVYREFAVHNGGNRDWRVTDPAATAEGAQQHLPNPVLELTIDDLSGATRAELLLDRWGGHLKTTSKQVRINNGDWLTIPELATTPPGHAPQRYYSQDNPVIDVPLSMLREGVNSIEGRCSTIDNYNWGQWGLYSAIIRVYVDESAEGAALPRITSPVAGATLAEHPLVEIDTGGLPADRVDVMAWYEGFDENGDGIFTDWHRGYFQPRRGEPADISQHVGTDADAPFSVTWDTTWIPDQRPGGIKLVARVRTAGGLWRVTPIVEGLSLKRTRRHVRLYTSRDVPEAFGVRVGQTKACSIELPAGEPLDAAREAILHLRTWHGTPEVHDWLKVNKTEIPLAGNNHHYDHDQLPVPISALRSGTNTIAIHSKTDHHMLEVLWPGPGLIVAYAE